MFNKKAKGPAVFGEINSKLNGIAFSKQSYTDLLYGDYFVGSKMSMRLRPYKGLFIVSESTSTVEGSSSNRVYAQYSINDNWKVKEVSLDSTGKFACSIDANNLLDSTLFSVQAEKSFQERGISKLYCDMRTVSQTTALSCHFNPLSLQCSAAMVFSMKKGVAGARITYDHCKSPSVDFSLQLPHNDVLYTLELLNTFEKAHFSLLFKPVKHLTMGSSIQVGIGSGEAPNINIGIKYKVSKDCKLYAKFNDQAELTVFTSVVLDSKLRLLGSFCVGLINPQSKCNRFGMGLECREERGIRAEYEYQRRKFLQRKDGKKRAWIVLLLAVFVNVGCIVLNRKFSIFNFSLVCLYFASNILCLYMLQILITIWKEEYGKDEYTPYLTNSSTNSSLNMTSNLWDDLKESSQQYTALHESEPVQQPVSKWSNWKPSLLRKVSDHLVTPLMKTFNVTPLRSVAEEVHAGTVDVNSRVYADDLTIRHYTDTDKASEDSKYVGDPSLQELEYRSSYPATKTKDKVIDTKYVNTEKARSIIDMLCIEPLIGRWCDNLRQFLYSKIKSSIVEVLGRNADLFEKELGISMKCLLHINNTTSCVYNKQSFAGHDLLDLLNHIRPAVVQNTKITQTPSFGGGFGSFSLSSTTQQQNNTQQEVATKAKQLLKAIDEQLKLEILLRTVENRTKSYFLQRLITLGNSPYLSDFVWNHNKGLEGNKISDSKIVMSFFVWYLDCVLVTEGDQSMPQNKFSYYHFVSSSVQQNTHLKSAIYIKEEVAPQTHYNVFCNNERWDIQPGSENVFLAIVVFLYAVKSFRNNHFHYRRVPYEVNSILN